MSESRDDTSVEKSRDPVVMEEMVIDVATESDSSGDEATAIEVEPTPEAGPTTDAQPTPELKAATDQTLNSITQFNERAQSDVLRAELQVKARHNRYHEFGRVVARCRFNSSLTSTPNSNESRRMKRASGASGTRRRATSLELRDG